MEMADIIKRPAGRPKVRQTVITLRPSANSSLKEITLIRTPTSSSSSSSGGRPRQITLLTKYPSPFNKRPFPNLNVTPSLPSQNSSVFTSEKIPRPPNAFMIFANEWRKRLALQHPSESNKIISVRLGQLWKSMNTNSKEIYYQRSRQAMQDHKQKYPGYVYNPKEARLRKALRVREQSSSRGSRSSSSVPAAWPRALTMNHHPHPLVSPTVYTEESKAMLHEQVDRESNMLHSYPDYLDLPYNLPPNDYTLDTQPWYPPYIQGGGGGGGYPSRTMDSKVPVDWTTAYSSEQGNYIRASPHSSPYSMQNHQEVNSLIMNGDHPPAVSVSEQTTPCESTCITPDHKPNVDQLICQNSDVTLVKGPEQQVKELLASAKVTSESSPLTNGCVKSEEPGSTRLPGFHQAFGSTEIGRFSQPDGFFEAAVAAENERKEDPDLLNLSFSPDSSIWTSSFFSYPESKCSPELFGFQEQEPLQFSILPDEFREPNCLYTQDNSFFNPQELLDPASIKVEGTDEFKPQDLSGVATQSHSPVIISENDNCCVVLESSAMNNNLKDYFSL